MKVLYAIWTIPSPKLRGTIQMDDTFFREGQKGVDEVNPLEASIEEIETIIRNAKSIVGWNLHFQLDMLHACHVNIAPHHKFVDMSRAMYTDARKPNKNRRNSFDPKAQGKLVDAVSHSLNECYQAEKPLDDALYLLRIWQVEF